MESAYLKCHVGPILAKAIADTVVAQPSNPQEYLALYLLHYLNVEEHRTAGDLRLRKAVEVREVCSQRHAQKEKAAAETIRRGIMHFRERLQKKKEQEAHLMEIYEEACLEAEELLEQEDAQRKQPEGGEPNGGATIDASSEDNPEERTMRLQLERQKERLDESRNNFYVAQRFIHYLQKTHLGQLKTTLLDSAERVRVAQMELESLKDLEQQTEEEVFSDAKPLSSGQDNIGNGRMSAIATELIARLRVQRSHKRIAVSHVLYRVLRCICYLLFNSTPKATDTPIKVATLIKPAVVVQLLRAFNPVATYDKNQPLKLEKILSHPRNEEEGEAEEAEEVVEAFPIPQQKTRQLRRVQRVMRSCLCDAEYICNANLSDYFDDDTLEEEELLENEVAKTEAAKTRRQEIEETVETQTKERGGITLYGLLRFLRAAADYRIARDAWVSTLHELSLPIPETEEMPEEDDPDDSDAVRQDDEEPLNEDGEVDYDEINRVQAKIGVDEDEALVKIWEIRDRRQQGVFQDLKQVIAKAGNEEEEEGENDEIK
ncbi:unnamed protein product [Phytomonas sp. Hart1]|nr:unnamed protein product [Phytomonas sp. Hart1]|eukprot:CCW68486.1 unnamed protein product [Phytomonas sp. isolate Hart1]